MIEALRVRKNGVEVERIKLDVAGTNNVDVIQEEILDRLGIYHEDYVDMMNVAFLQERNETIVAYYDVDHVDLKVDSIVIIPPQIVIDGMKDKFRIPSEAILVVENYRTGEYVNDYRFLNAITIV